MNHEAHQHHEPGAPGSTPTEGPTGRDAAATRPPLPTPSWVSGLAARLTRRQRTAPACATAHTPAGTEQALRRVEALRPGRAVVRTAFGRLVPQPPPEAAAGPSCPTAGNGGEPAAAPGSAASTPTAADGAALDRSALRGAPFAGTSLAGASFESVEGLRGTGKSTVAPLLAEARGGVFVPTIPAAYLPLRRFVDGQDDVEARLCFYLSALFAAVTEIRGHLAAGRPVVVESYFARCLATHRALGSRIGLTLPPGLPQPVSYLLVCSEEERRRRLLCRERPTTRWDARSEAAVDGIRTGYAAHRMHRVDTTGLAPDAIVRAILALSPAPAGSTAGNPTEDGADDPAADPLSPPGPARRPDADTTGTPRAREEEPLAGTH